MAEKKLVMISSTARDLPDYRKQVEDACLRVGMFPKMMDHLPALDADAIKASLDMVDKADVYVGVFAHRYGYVPDGHEISITQMEYERAVERETPRLIFLMHDKVPVLPEDFDKGEAAVMLDKLKDQLKKERVANFFKNPDDLRAQVIHSLVEIQKILESEKVDEAGKPTPEALVASLHYISDIPEPPEPYIAHPYTLLQVRGLIGRQKELDWLTDWIAKPKRFGHAHILNVSPSRSRKSWRLRTSMRQADRRPRRWPPASTTSPTSPSRPRPTSPIPTRCCKCAASSGGRRNSAG